jgi:hypothetical protein
MEILTEINAARTRAHRAAERVPTMAEVIARGGRHVVVWARNYRWYAALVEVARIQPTPISPPTCRRTITALDADTGMVVGVTYGPVQEGVASRLDILTGEAYTMLAFQPHYHALAVEALTARIPRP